MASSNKKHMICWYTAGICLILLFLIISSFSVEFAYGENYLERPLVLLVSLLILACLVFMVPLLWARSVEHNGGLLAWIIGVGLLLRLLMLPSYPIQADDFYRYLWDGAVTASLHNPYALSPDEIRKGAGKDHVIPGEVADLAEHSWAKEFGGRVIDRVNHRDLRTIYPPVAQFFFGVSHLISPWSLVGWRLLLLGVDLVIIVLLFRLLSRLNIPRTASAIYWWNPVVIKEIYNSGHMDIIILPFVLGAFLFMGSGRPRWASGLLSLAVGCKIWPVMLLPLFLRRMNNTVIRFQSLAISFFLMGLMLMPFFINEFDHSSGLYSYGVNWEVNSAFFKIIKGIVSQFLKCITGGGGPETAAYLARGVTFVLLVAWVLFLSRVPIKDERDFWQRGVAVCAAIFLLSPTGYPWYFIWFLPFLVVFQYPSLMVLNLLLPLYYLRFYFLYRGTPEFFEGIVVWVEFMPVWGLLAMEGWRRWQNSKKNHLTSQPILS